MCVCVFARRGIVYARFESLIIARESGEIAPACLSAPPVCSLSSRWLDAGLFFKRRICRWSTVFFPVVFFFFLRILEGYMIYIGVNQRRVRESDRVNKLTCLFMRAAAGYYDMIHSRVLMLMHLCTLLQVKQTPA